MRSIALLFQLFAVVSLWSCSAAICRKIEAYDFLYQSINGESLSSPALVQHDPDVPIYYIDLVDGRVFLSGHLRGYGTTIESYRSFKHVTVLEEVEDFVGRYVPNFTYDNHNIRHVDFRRLSDEEIVLEISFGGSTSIWVAHGYLTGKRIRSSKKLPGSCDLIRLRRGRDE